MRRQIAGRSAGTEGYRGCLRGSGTLSTDGAAQPLHEAVEAAVQSAHRLEQQPPLGDLISACNSVAQLLRQAAEGAARLARRLGERPPLCEVRLRHQRHCTAANTFIDIHFHVHTVRHVTFGSLWCTLCKVRLRRTQHCCCSLTSRSPSNTTMRQ